MTIPPSIFTEIKHILSEILVTYDADYWQEDTQLLGHLPEFDSMAVVTLLTTLEESFDFVVDDDEIDGEVFESVSTLCQFVQMKVA